MIKKIIAAILSLTLTAGLLAGCSSDDSSISDSGELDSSLSVRTVQLPDDIAGAKFDNNYIMKVDGVEIPTGLYKYCFNNIKNSSYDGGNEEYWLTNQDKLALLKKDAEEFVINYALIEILSKENGVEMTEEEKSKVDEELALEAEQYGGIESFSSVLLSYYGINHDTYSYLYHNNALGQKLFAKLYGENGTVDVPKQDVLDFHNQYVYVKHILILDNKEEDSSVTDTSLERATKILERIKNGEDFDSLMNEYSDDFGGLQTYPDGYFFDNSVNFVEEFKATSFALKDGEVSELVRVESVGYSGYHIIKRLSINDYAEKHYAELKDEYSNSLMNALINEKAKNVSVTFADGYDKIGVRSFS